MTRLFRFLKRGVKSVLSRITGREVPKPDPARDFPAAWSVDRGKSFSEWNGLRFELVRSMDGLLKLADGWRALTAGLTPARHFHHVEWFLAVTRTMDEDKDGSYLYVAIYESQKLVGIVPLRVARVWIEGQPDPIRALRLLSNVRETPSARDVIFAESIIDADVFTGLIRYLDKMNSWWDVLAITDVIEGSHAHAAFLKASKSLPSLTTPARATGGRVEFLSCGPDATPMGRLSQKFRHNLRTSKNKLVSREVRFVCASTPDELSDAYPKLIAVEASGWKNDSAYSIANHPRFEAFLRHLMSYLGPTGGCEIHLMQLDGVTIGGMFCVVFGQIGFMHVIGYDEACSKLSPGHLLIENLVKSRGGSGQLNMVTSGHATDWFSGYWKPDHILKTSDHFLFRPSRRGARAAIRRSPAPKACA
jgi:CelD/BcsL family acetyltransferase involved in cellulose biosynthesis